jgi:SRSO17 transposase
MDGAAGKIDNCQVAVFGLLTDGERCTPIDLQPYLPDRWIKDPARREAAGLRRSRASIS